MYPRFAAAEIEQALADTRVVLLAGPRQAGKTTLAQSLADGSRSFQTLDNATTLAAATADATGFVRSLDRAIVDEIQRAPGLLLAIKESADADPRPGRFLLSGSANLMTLPRVARAHATAGKTQPDADRPLSRATASPYCEMIMGREGRPPSQAAFGQERLTR